MTYEHYEKHPNSTLITKKITRSRCTNDPQVAQT
jgi:hypothetical protein